MDWSRIETLFSSALDLPPSEREAFLLENAKDEAELAKVRRLIEASQLTSGFLQTDVADHEERRFLEPDTIVGQWRVVELIGAGGMGEVYKVVRETGDFEQTAALKLVRDGFSQIGKRFTTERQIAANLNHPNIARLIDGGESPDGRPYMVVDLVHGQPITDYARRERLTERQRLKLFLNLCDAVIHAHGQFVLHRDIKPQNVLVEGDGTLKLIDFGVAYLLDDKTDTASGPITLAYAAPEQLSGRAVGVATDIFALGVLMHELLTGNRPSGSTDPNIRTDLASVIRKCTASDVESRYLSVDGLRNDLERYLRSEPVKAHGGGALYRAHRLVDRYRVAAVAIAIMIGGLVTALIVSVNANRQTTAALRQVSLSGEQWEFEARTTRGLRRALLQVYGATSDDGHRVSSESIDSRLLEILDEAELGARDGSTQEAHDMFAIGGHFMRRFDHEKAILAFERLLATGIDDPLLVLDAKSSLAWSLREVGREQEGLRLAEEVSRERSRHDGPYSRNVIQAEHIVARSVATEESRQLLIDSLVDAIEEESKRSPEDRFYTHWYYNQIGVVHLRSGEYAKAAEAFVSEFEHARELGVRSLELLATATNAAQGQIYVLDQADEPLTYLPDYLMYANGERGDDPDRLGFMHSLIADAALSEGRYEHAERSTAQAFSLLSGSRDYRLGWYYQVGVSRIRSLIRLQRLEEAKAVFQDLEGGELPETEAAQATRRCMIAFAASWFALESGDTDSATASMNEGISFCSGGPNRLLRAPFRYQADAILSRLET